MLVLYIKISFNQRYIFFSRNKVTVILKLALLASHMAETLIENLRKTSECDIIFASGGGTGGCSRCTPALAATNSSQLILDIPENVKTLVGI